MANGKGCVMAFKENLLKKISLDQMKQRVMVTLGASGSERRIDKKAMKDLLKAADFRHMNMRGLDLYTPDDREKDGKQMILVLDNELSVYHTTVNDVLLRKEPTLKEMISIKNAMRILNDKDVVVSRRDQSVETVYRECMARLELSYTSDDIKKLEYDGRAALEWNDGEALIETLTVFSELLGYVPEPGVLMIEHHHIRGTLVRSDSGKTLFGPSVIYSQKDGTIRMIMEKTDLADKDAVELFRQKALGDKDSDLVGPSVIVFLSEEVIRTKPVVQCR